MKILELKHTMPEMNLFLQWAYIDWTEQNKGSVNLKTIEIILTETEREEKFFKKGTEYLRLMER